MLPLQLLATGERELRLLGSSGRACSVQQRWIGSYSRPSGQVCLFKWSVSSGLRLATLLSPCTTDSTSPGIPL